MQSLLINTLMHRLLCFYQHNPSSSTVQILLFSLFSIHNAKCNLSPHSKLQSSRPSHTLDKHPQDTLKNRMKTISEKDRLAMHRISLSDYVIIMDIIESNRKLKDFTNGSLPSTLALASHLAETPRSKFHY